jgi:hypothetical protein
MRARTYRDWGNTKQNIKTSAKKRLGLYEWKQHKTWFVEESLRFFLNESG